MRINRPQSFIIGSAIAFALAGFLSWMASPFAQQLVGPWATVTTVTNGAVVQIGAINPTRRSFEICNGAAGSLVYVLPALTPAGAAVNPTTTSGIPIASNACFLPPQNLSAQGTGFGGNQAWNAIASGANAVVAFVEW